MTDVVQKRRREQAGCLENVTRKRKVFEEVHAFIEPGGEASFPIDRQEVLENAKPGWHLPYTFADVAFANRQLVQVDEQCSQDCVLARSVAVTWLPPQRLL